MNYRQTIQQLLDAGRPDLAEAYIRISHQIAALAEISQAVMKGAHRDMVETTDLLEPVE